VKSQNENKSENNGVLIIAFAKQKHLFSTGLVMWKNEAVRIAREFSRYFKEESMKAAKF
jgi:hypothetical protein